MKDDTKRNIVLGGLVLGGAWYLTRGEDTEAGGFGGGGGIPLLAADTEDAAENDTIINYILPTPPTFEGFDEAVAAAPVSKKPTYAPSLIPTYPLEYYSAGGVSELSAAATPAQKLKSVMELQHFGDPFAYAFSGRRDAPADISGIVDSKKDAVIAQTPKEKPVQWGEASVGGFFDFLAPLTQLGKGARGRDIASPKSDVKSAAVATKKVEAQRASSRAATKIPAPPKIAAPSTSSSSKRSTGSSSKKSRSSTGYKARGLVGRGSSKSSPGRTAAAAYRKRKRYG